MTTRSYRLAAFGVALGAACFGAACGGGAGSAVAPPPGGRVPSPSPTASASPSPTIDPSAKIRHVVIILQENRSFDNMFNGFPGADTVRTGKMSDGRTVALTPVGLGSSRDLRHRHYTWWVSYDGGKMDGFDVDRNPLEQPTTPYEYVTQGDVQPYWDLASRYTLADRMFQSATSGSYPSHLYIVAAQSALVIGDPGTAPWGCDSPRGTTVALIGPNGKELPGPFPCFSYPTLADRMDAASVSWRFYTPSLDVNGGAWDSFDSFTQVRYGPDWTNDVVSPETQVLQDIANGQLAQVTWIVPAFATSDHPGSHEALGPQWVTSIVDAIGASPFWSSTAVFITWDDWGGWYDHVPPAQLDQMGLGFRVPLIVVSPYARHGYVSHAQHEFGSILRFTEEALKLPDLGQSDVRADDFADCFDFSQTPAPFFRIRTTHDAAYFIAHPPAGGPPDTDL